MFQHTAARRRLLVFSRYSAQLALVSTHSRTEAAASIEVYIIAPVLFQHTAARRRLHVLHEFLHVE